MRIVPISIGAALAVLLVGSLARTPGQTPDRPATLTSAVALDVTRAEVEKMINGAEIR